MLLLFGDLGLVLNLRIEPDWDKVPELVAEPTLGGFKPPAVVLVDRHLVLGIKLCEFLVGHCF